jgi:outer membrane immunogenic protein
VGAHGGINFLLGTNIIGGFEGGLSNLDEQDSVFASGTILSLVTNDGFSFTRRSVLDFDWQGTIRGRLGFVNGSTLFFATGGVAFLNLDWSETTFLQRSSGFGPSSALSHSDSETLVGGAVGGGFETAITPTIFFGADYLYENFGSWNSVPHGFINVQSGKIDDIDIHKVRVRITVKLGGPAP